MKKKLLSIVEAMGGGVFTYIVEMSNALTRYFDVSVAYAVRGETPENFRDYFLPEVHLYEVKHFTRSPHPAKDYKAFFEIRELVREIQPDLIHLHSSKAGILGRWAIDGKKFPLFYTPHAYSFLMTNYDPFRRKLYYELEKAAAKKPCLTISCSYGEHLETLKLTENAVYINNGIDVDCIEEELADCETREENYREPVVYTIGRICYQKNPVLFNETAEKLPGLSFVWIGDGDMRASLTSENIEITGWMNRNEVLRSANRGDIFLLTSYWEGLAISLLESMAMKKLCIVSDVIGSRDVIRDGENGFICHTAEEFADRIRWAQENPEKAKALAEQAYRDAKEQYDVSIVAEKYRDVYEGTYQKFHEKEKG